MIVVSVFLLLSCLAVPIAFVRLRKDKPNMIRSFRMPLGLSFSYITYLFISFMLVQCGNIALWVAIIFHLVLFFVYCAIYYKKIGRAAMAFASSWSIFAYLAIVLIFSYMNEAGNFENMSMAVVFIVSMTVTYYLLVHQKSYNKHTA